MKYRVVLMVLFCIIRNSVAIEKTTTENPSGLNKTKRTINSAYVRNYGEEKPVVVYTDNVGESSASLSGLYVPVTIKPIFDPENSKQVSAQQVVYEFQQTPTNAVSNVHVNQYYQPVHHKNDNEPTIISGSESVASPVQHSSLIRHNQNVPQVQYHPLHITSPYHVQTQQYIPGKYLYVNGKIAFQPSFQQLQPHPQQQKYYKPSTPVQSNYQRGGFQPPLQHQFKPITKPIPPPVKEEKEEKKEEEEEQIEDDQEEEPEDDEDHTSYEDDDDEDHDRYFGRYSFDDDEEEESIDEEDDDTDKKSSKYIPKTHKYNKKTKSKKPSKYSNNYKYGEHYSTHSSYEKPPRSHKKHKNHKHSSKSHKNRPKKIENIQGKQSENVPIVHKQKIFREKWYVTKSAADKN